MQFLIGIIFGIILATVGFTGVAKLLDHGVDKVKAVSVEVAK